MSESVTVTFEGKQAANELMVLDSKYNALSTRVRRTTLDFTNQSTVIDAIPGSYRVLDDSIKKNVETQEKSSRLSRAIIGDYGRMIARFSLLATGAYILRDAISKVNDEHERGEKAAADHAKSIAKLTDAAKMPIGSMKSLGESVAMAQIVTGASTEEMEANGIQLAKTGGLAGKSREQIAGMMIAMQRLKETGADVNKITEEMQKKGIAITPESLAGTSAELERLRALKPRAKEEKLLLRAIKSRRLERAPTPTAAEISRFEEGTAAGADLRRGLERRQFAEDWKNKGRGPVSGWFAQAAVDVGEFVGMSPDSDVLEARRKVSERLKGAQEAASFQIIAPKASAVSSGRQATRSTSIPARARE